MSLLTWTEFKDRHATSKRQRSSTWPDLIERLRTGKGKTKSDCPWLKLATFGDAATPSGCLRHDENVVEIFGVEGDYDGGQVQPGEAVEMLERALVKAVVYTSPSHTPEKPRWRVLAPTSKPMPPETRSALLARINGVLGGILAPESFTLSQSYYFGATDDAVDYRVLVTFDDPDEGHCVDELDELDDIAIGKRVNGHDHEAPRPGEHVFEAKVAELGRRLKTGDGRRELLKSFIASRSARGLRGDDLRLLVEGIAARYFDASDPFGDDDVDGIITWANQKDEPPPRDAEPQADPVEALGRFFVTDEQVQKMKETKLIWRNLIARGHVAVWSAPPNGGKTTLARLAAAELAADELVVLFFQEDAGAGDLPMLHRHASENGDKLLNSTLAGGVPDDQITALHGLVRGGADLSKYVMFFDTLKKYVDLMSKKSSREFFLLMRSLTQRGATVVLLGHTNKHRGIDGKLVFEGVGDVRSDVDELIYIEATDKDAAGVVLLTMRPDKVRSRVKEATFRLDTHTMDVEPMPAVVDVGELRRRAAQQAEDAQVIQATKDALADGGMSKYRLIARVVSATGVGERTVRGVINRYLSTDPQDEHALWIETYMRENNKHYVSLKP